VPTYTYTCTACNAHVEKRQSFSDPPLTTCEQCGGTLRKIIHPVGIVFKGSGWYVTDSRSSKATTNGPSSSTDAESGSSAKDSPTKEASSKESSSKESSGSKDSGRTKESSSSKESSASTASTKNSGSSSEKS
jgi:putative FmdB family regulatory protein